MDSLLDAGNKKTFNYITFILTNVVKNEAHVARLQGKVPFKESRRQTQTLGSGSGVQNPSSGPARPGLVRVSVGCSAFLF